MHATATCRLAPSPTGRLHLGNLSSLLLATIQARRERARLVLRVEDLDPPRCVEGADQQAMDDLRWLGVTWSHGPGADDALAPYYQSQRSALYDAAIARLDAAGLVYRCTCSRRDIRDVLSAPHTPFDPGTEYPGTCADGSADPHAEAALRFRAHGTIDHEDGVFGAMRHDIAKQPGDFVIRRRDGLYAYQLAVVVDDIAMGVTHILRGHDLLDSTPRQLALFDALGAPRPRTWHVPLLVDARGDRLSKRVGSADTTLLRDVGWTPELLIGALLCLWGWRDALRPATLDDATRAWAPATLARPEIRVPDPFFDGPDAFRHALRDPA